MSKREIVLKVAEALMHEDYQTERSPVIVDGRWPPVMEALCLLPEEELPAKDIGEWLSCFINEYLSQ